MGGQALGVGQRDGRGRERGERGRVAADDRGALQEVETDRPDEKRAARLVGSTWLEPAT